MYVDRNGYYRYNVSDRLVHRNICWEEWGEFPRDWDVHHVNGNKLNNDVNNLIALPSKLHSKIHTIQPRPTRNSCIELLNQYTDGFKDVPQPKKKRVKVLKKVSSKLKKEYREQRAAKQRAKRLEFINKCPTEQRNINGQIVVIRKLPNSRLCSTFEKVKN